MTAFYTYVHIRNDSNSIFYVGQGSGRRANAKNGRGENWEEIVNKHGYTVKILENFESKNDSISHERYLITSLRACGLKLCNKTDGGTGGARKGTGGAMPGAGRKPFDEPTKRRVIRLTDPQNAMHMKLGGSGFYQGFLNLKIKEGEGTK